MDRFDIEAAPPAALNPPEDDGLAAELGVLVDEGFLEMGVNPEGESVYWPTQLGIEVLEMEPVI